MVIHESDKDDINLGLPDLLRTASPTGASAVNRELPPTIRIETDEPQVQVSVRWNMVFTWQAPIMLMSYSVVFFLMGLTIYVLTPLYDGREFDGESRVSAAVPVGFHAKVIPRRC
jgi:hypothetical protein